VSAAQLATANFELRPLADTDRDDLFAHLSDAATVAFMDIEPLGDIAGAEAIIAWASGLATSGDGVRWAIRDRAGAFVGTAGFNALVRERAARGEIAYDVVRPCWRQGVMAEVLPAVLDHGFGALALHRIEAMVTPGNTASAALLEGHGFQLEGTLRGYAHWKGRYWDQWLYARLAD
jgi:ribosomal-protein-alanine N-acetyltransferase